MRVLAKKNGSSFSEVDLAEKFQTSREPKK